MTPHRTSSSDRVTLYLEQTGRGHAHAEELPGDASTRRYVRITASGDSSRILLVHPDAIEADTLPFLNVADLLHRMEVPIPTVLAVEPALGIVELEDLGDVTLELFLAGATPEERRASYLEAVALIDRMQARGRALASSAYLPFGLAFDIEKLMWELDFFVTHFMVGARQAVLSEDQRSALAVEFKEIAAELASEPRVFCHRDYHSRNLMRHLDRLYVIDFQDARMGPDTYDLVSLLRDCYVDQPAPFVDEMIDEYRRLSGDAGEREFRRRFDLMSVQRHLKALGTFGYQASAVGTARYQGAVPRTLNYLCEVFDRHPRFDRLRAKLAAVVPELG